MKINKCELVQDTVKRALKSSLSRRSVLIICATVPNLLAQASKAPTSPLRSPFKISHRLQEETESVKRGLSTWAWVCVENLQNNSQLSVFNFVCAASGWVIPAVVMDTNVGNPGYWYIWIAPCVGPTGTCDKRKGAAVPLTWPLPLALSKREKITSSPAATWRGLRRSDLLLGGWNTAGWCWNVPEAGCIDTQDTGRALISTLWLEFVICASASPCNRTGSKNTCDSFWDRHIVRWLMWRCTACSRGAQTQSALFFCCDLVFNQWFTCMWIRR